MRKKTPLPAVEVGRRIRERRKALGLTQGDVAKKARMTVGKVSELENGRSGSRGPTLSRLYQVADALDCSPASFLAA